MKPLQHLLEKEETKRMLAEKIEKDKKGLSLFKKMDKNKTKFTANDIVTLVMRYAANGIYEKDVYKKWAKEWYREWYLQSDHWENFRDSILKKHNGKCELCQRSGKILDIHHRTYENIFFEKRKDVLIICRDCHSKIHPE